VVWWYGVVGSSTAHSCTNNLSLLLVNDDGVQVLATGWMVIKERDRKEAVWNYSIPVFVFI
jgi:hypothetical protein